MKTGTRCAELLSKMAEWTVQNGFGESDPLSQSESATPENIL